MRKSSKKSRKRLELPGQPTKKKEDKDVYDLMDLEDERQIREEIMGRFVDDYVYSFPMETREGRKIIYGLSYAGTKEFAKGANIRGKALYTATDLPPIVEEHDTYWLAKVQCVDKITGLAIWGVKKQSKRKKGGQIDEHAEAVAVSKAQRNGLQGLMPKGMVQEFIKEYIKKKGQVKEIGSKKEITTSTKPTPEKTDSREMWGRLINRLAAKIAVKKRIKKSLIITEAVEDKTNKHDLTECSIDELKEISTYLEEELAVDKGPKKEVAKPSEITKDFYND